MVLVNEPILLRLGQAVDNAFALRRSFQATLVPGIRNYLFGLPVEVYSEVVDEG